MRDIATTTLAKLRSIYPSGYSTLKTDEQKKGYSSEFILALVNEGVNCQEMIDKGINRAREDSKNNKFLPAPHLFADWCKTQPEDIGLMSAEDAYIYASKECGKRGVKSWPDDVIYQTASDVSFFRLSTETKKEVWPDFDRAYKENCKKALSGYVFKRPKDRMIEKVEDKPLSKQENAKRMKALRASVGM